MKATDTLIKQFREHGFTFEYPGFFMTHANGYNFTVGIDEADVPFLCQATTYDGDSIEVDYGECKSIDEVGAALERFRKENPVPKDAPLFLQEFPDFSMPFKPEDYGLTDTSWHNDVCPSFSVVKAEVNVETLWCDYFFPEQREMQEKRFTYFTYDPNGEHNEPLATLLETDDVDEAKAFLLKRITERLGDKFAEVLREWLTASEFETMRKRNRKHANDGCCASHDFCDSNMAMDEAMREVGFRQMMVGDWVTENDHLRDLWNAAWDYARVKHLTAKGSK